MQDPKRSTQEKPRRAKDLQENDEQKAAGNRAGIDVSRDGLVVDDDTLDVSDDGLEVD